MQNSSLINVGFLMKQKKHFFLNSAVVKHEYHQQFMFLKWCTPVQFPWLLFETLNLKQLPL